MILCLGLVTCLIDPASVWAAQNSSCLGIAPVEQTIDQADVVYFGTVTSTRPDSVQFLLVEAIKGQVETTPVLLAGGSHFLAGHSYIVFAHARTTINDVPPSYRPLECAPALEIVGDDRRLVDRGRQIAREQARATERPRVGVYPPKKIQDAAPVWPRQAQVPQDSAAVAVILEVTITAVGVVSDVRVLRSVPSFDEAAIEVARQWKYLPALVNGVAMPVTTTETVVFRRQ